MDASLVIDYLARWGHFLFGITWIGMLYYFNFVQGEYFKVADASSRTDAFVKLVPRALWWFRWGAMFTFITGVILLGFRHMGLTIDIVVGAVLATLMFLNVWLIIWPNQKVVIASNEQVKAGGEALPEAAAAAPKAALASRTNTLFSIPMLFFMGAASHLTTFNNGTNDAIYWILALIVILAVEINSLVGSGLATHKPLGTVSGTIHAGLGLTLVLFLLGVIVN